VSVLIVTQVAMVGLMAGAYILVTQRATDADVTARFIELASAPSPPAPPSPPGLPNPPPGASPPPSPPPSPTGSWVQVGQDIEGEIVNDQILATSISADGARISTMRSLSDASGQVRVYELVGSNWTQVGQDLNGDAAGDLFGMTSKLSGDGTRLIVSAMYADSEVGSDSGVVRIYDLVDDLWTQIGSDLNGEAAGDRYGHGVAITPDGTHVAVSTAFNVGSGSTRGMAEVFELVDGTWTQLGETFRGTSSTNLAANSNRMSLADSGKRIALSDENVIIYDLIDGAWAQVGNVLSGNGEASLLSLSGDGEQMAYFRAVAPPLRYGVGERNEYELLVFRYLGQNSRWNQVGNNLYFSDANSLYGTSDGNRFCMGIDVTPGDESALRILDFQFGAWTQVSEDITALTSTGWAHDRGPTPAISSDGKRVVHNAYLASPSPDRAAAGYVRVYDLII